MATAGDQEHNLEDNLDEKLDDNLEDILTDDDLESEIELVSELVVAATSSDRPLRQDEVDRLLGVERHDDGTASGSDI